ncbi:MAG: S9 family peptidase [Herpetosiphonaceae bacterium]|nr:S9 family peptidase [Herpetosiphonaceae bacterium]
MIMTAHPPIAPIVPHETTLHGETLVDNYFWLRDRSNPDVVAYLEAENQYLTDVIRPTEALQKQLYSELRGRIKEADRSVPVPHDGYLYYSRTEEGLQYPIFCRKRGDLEAVEEVLLDQNQLAAGHSYCRLGAYKVSPDHRTLAYSVDTSGSEQYTLFVKDLASGQFLSDQIPNTYYGVEWANDNHTIFYTVLDMAMRPYQLFRHTVGTASSFDMLVYHELDEAFFVDIAKTASKMFLLLALHSTTTSEVRFMPADEPQAPFKMIHPRQSGMEYSVEHHDDRFLIVTNDEALNFKLVEAPIATPEKAYWRELLAHRSAVLLDGIDVFHNHLVLYEREQGLKRIRITDPYGHDVRDVEFPEPVYTYVPGPNAEFNTNILRFTYSSLVTPDSIIDYDMQLGTWHLRKQDEIPSGYDPSLYASDRLIALAADGTAVPISLVYRKGLRRDHSNPTLLYGYGSYGITIDPAFSSRRLSLLDRGFIYAIAHIRGGSDLGRAWYDDGKLNHKQNTFTDFIACAEHLIAAGYTAPQHLAISGASAGGLLMGAVVNMRTDLWQAVIAKVPFVDVINTMSDPTLPLTVIEYEQWGNPNDPDTYHYLKSYSPYDNVAAKDYPNMLVTTGMNDPRVSYWEPAKWVARLRALKTGRRLLLLKTDMGSGHGGASGRFDALEETALEYAFLLNVIETSTT